MILYVFRKESLPVNNKGQRSTTTRETTDVPRLGANVSLRSERGGGDSGGPCSLFTDLGAADLARAATQRQRLRGGSGWETTRGRWGEDETG